jgi:AraC-like DNA-binding protein
MVLLDEGGRGRPHTRLISPVANLSTWVEHFWIQEGYSPSPSRPWRILPDSSPHLIFSTERGGPPGVAASFGIVGARSIFRDVDVSSRAITVGARLKAGALFDLTGSRADIFTDRAFPAEDVFGPTGKQLVERMMQGTTVDALDHLKAFLGSLLTFPRNQVPFHDALQSSRSVSGLARTLNLSERAVYGRATEVAGIPPKRLLRILRLHRALQHANRRRTWSETAYLAGYADQAHMVRDFKSLLGDSPDAWRRRASDLFKTTVRHC